MTRKSRIDSASEQVRVMGEASKQIHPPSHIPLDGDDMVFFANVIDEFARSEWTAHQLELAAMLSRTLCDLNREQQTLRTEGMIARRENGTTVENPRMRVVKSLTGDILSFRRSLSLHARAKSGEPRDVGKRRGMAKGIEDDSPLNDNLLASPH